jgi:hypothetical protein
VGLPTTLSQNPLEPHVVPTLVYHALLRVPNWRLSECECAPNDCPVEPMRPSAQRSQVRVKVFGLALKCSWRNCQPLAPLTWK